MQITENKIIYNLSGTNQLCTRVSLTFSKLKEMGFTPQNKEALVGYEKDYIIIKKKPKKLLKMVSKGKLENGVLLFDRDFDNIANVYTNGVYEENLLFTNKIYKPFYLGVELIGYEEIENDNL